MITDLQCDRCNFFNAAVISKPINQPWNGESVNVIKDLWLILFSGLLSVVQIGLQASNQASQRVSFSYSTTETPGWVATGHSSLAYARQDKWQLDGVRVCVSAFNSS